MIQIGRIKWLSAREIPAITGTSLAEVKAVIDRSALPFLVYRGDKYYRSVEICAQFGITGRCHACLKEIEGEKNYCSQSCWVAAMGDDAAEKDEIVLGIPAISVSVSAHLMRKIREEASRLEMDLPTVIRFLLDEGIQKQRRLPAL